MPGSKHITSYSETATLRCERVLGTLLRSVGAPWLDRICLVGGLVPRYLVPHAAADLQTGHVGSTDVDVALGLAVASSGGAYATLETNLKRAGLHRYRDSSWQWATDVDGATVMVELLGEDPDTARGNLFRPKVVPPSGAGRLALLCVRGVELALRDRFVAEREVTLLDGATSPVGIPVAGLTSFLALKADAYLDRREPKDVYDLIYVLRHWPEGPKAAAADFVRSTVADDPFVSAALGRLDLDFASSDHVGPRDYARFIGGASGSEEAGLRDDALLTWRLFKESRR